MRTDLDTTVRQSIWAIVPMKAPGEGSKQRLATVLDSGARKSLSLAMLEDVLCQLAAVTALDGILLVTGDGELEAIGKRFPVTLHPEPVDNPDGLNGAVGAAARHLAALGVDSVLVVHGDLPLLAAQDVTQLLASHGVGRAPRVTLVPDDQGEGTNVMVVTPPLALPFAYGRDSFERHCLLAEERGLKVTVFPSQTLSVDIDTPDDLCALASQCARDPILRQRLTCRLLDSLDLLSLRRPPVAAVLR